VAGIAALLAGTLFPSLVRADATALPFTPPVSWQPLPSVFAPSTPLDWSDGPSSLIVSRINAPLPFDALERGLKLAAGATGRIVSSTTPTICGKRAAALTIALSDAAGTLDEQIQGLDNATYIAIYRHPTGSPADPVVSALLANFCGAKTLAAAAPPAGWKAHRIALLGSWISPAVHTLTAVAMDPEPDTEGLAKEAVGTTIKSPNVTIVSQSGGTLCGNPAQFITANAHPAGQSPMNVQVELTQSSSAAYVLVYTYPDGAQPDSAATDSLKTLCAKGALAPSSPAPSATP